MTVKYYLITDLGYDGMSVMQFDNEAEAMQRYIEDEVRTKRNSSEFGIHYDGVALIKGEIIKSKDLDLS